MRSRMLAWLAVPLLALAGCDAIVHTVLEDDEEPPVKNEAGVMAVGQQFGEAIWKENYAAAYDLLTTSRKSEQSLEQFTVDAKQQRQEYFGEMKPTSVGVEPYMLFQDEFAEWSNPPSDLTYDKLLGFGMVAWRFEGPPYGAEVDVAVVDEAGQPKIAHIDWADEY
jgi:hypothetical protein